MAEFNNLFALGKTRLELIGKYADLLMQAYNQGEVDESQVSAQVLNRLVEARILWRPDEQHGLCLRAGVNELIANLVQDERKRQINAEVQTHLDWIGTRIYSYRSAKNKGDYTAAEHHMQLLAERVHDMQDQFGQAIDSLWHRLNSEFGFVSSLEDKIREIELAQKQIRRLLDGFALIDFDQLIQLAGTDGRLRKLLVSQLQAKISQLSGALLEVQKRLAELMARFRQQQERAMLVTRMAAFLRQHPGFQVGDYAMRSQVPNVVNQAQALPLLAAPALDRAEDMQTLSSIARQLDRPDTGDKPEAKAEQPASIAAMTQIKSQEKQLKKDVEQFYLSLLDSQSQTSALEYLSEQELEWDAEIWLYQVWGEYIGMAESEKRAFRLIKTDRPVSHYNQLHLVEDILCEVDFFSLVS